MQTDTPAPASPGEATPIGPARAFVVRSPRRTWAVPLLLLLNTCVYVSVVLSGIEWEQFDWSEVARAATNPTTSDLLRFGASHGPYVAQGDWWRLLSCAFVHVGFVHFMVNMASLFALRIVESFYGSGAFLLLYLMSAIGGSACSILWHPSTVSAGASGAIFGMAGALVAFFLAHRHSIPELFLRPVLRALILMIAVNLTIGALVDVIDNMAHLGGLATGLIAGRALDRDPQGSARLDTRRLVRATIPAILLGLLCVLVPWRASSAQDIRPELASGQALRELRLGHREAARAIVEAGLARDATNPDLLGVRAHLAILEGDPRAALVDLDELLYQRPQDYPARELRAALLRALGRYTEALEDARYLVQHDPDEPRHRQLAGELDWCLARWREAAVEFGVVARRKGEGAIEGQLYLWVARCRMGEEEQATRELRHYLALPRIAEDSALELSLAGLFAGQARLEELLATFDRHGAPSAELVRLYFFAGVWCGLRNHPEEAHALLRRAADSPPSAEGPWLLARCELERFEKN